eukprot:3547139-Amphidinium_carterae.1
MFDPLFASSSCPPSTCAVSLSNQARRTTSRIVDLVVGRASHARACPTLRRRVQACFCGMWWMAWRCCASIVACSLALSINTDSSAGKAVASRLGLNKKTNHVQLKYLYMQDIEQRGEMTITKIQTTHNPAD